MELESRLQRLDDDEHSEGRDDTEEEEEPSATLDNVFQTLKRRTVDNLGFVRDSGFTDNNGVFISASDMDV